MKTKNNVQKTILRGAAVLVSFVLISYTVSAHEFWTKLITNSSFNEIAIAMVDASGKTKKAANTEVQNSATNLNEVYEPALKLEYWMTSDIYFGNSTIQEIEETETELQLESWMFNENLFKGASEVEQPLKLENWMTSDKFWES